MLLIDCPFCGQRAETEFHCGGEGHIERPLKPDALSDEEWADYVFAKKNPKGVSYERWNHAQGCRRWFMLARSTTTERILKVYASGEPAPVAEVEGQ